jgi:hypothetical protein
VERVEPSAGTSREPPTTNGAQAKPGGASVAHPDGSLAATREAIAARFRNRPDPEPLGEQEEPDASPVRLV